MWIQIVVLVHARALCGRPDYQIEVTSVSEAI
jgi:hypothetical protein